jgi:hypothetical protein
MDISATTLSACQISSDAFERSQCRLGLHAPDLERQRTADRILDRGTLAGRKKDAL